ncbi:MAG: DUF1761 domain-containing protein [Pseudomonadales bacterium]
MDPATAFSAINWLSVLGAAVSAFVVGGLWYGPLFGKAWMAETGVTEEAMANRNQAKIFAGAFVLNLVMVVNLAMFVGPGVGWLMALRQILHPGLLDCCHAGRV